MRWESIFRYAQDIWAPMACCSSWVVFLYAALCKMPADAEGWLACGWPCSPYR